MAARFGPRAREIDEQAAGRGHAWAEREHRHQECDQEQRRAEALPRTAGGWRGHAAPGAGQPDDHGRNQQQQATQRYWKPSKSCPRGGARNEEELRPPACVIGLNRFIE